MKVQLVGSFYNDVITECSIPEVIDVSESDYTAKSFNKSGTEDADDAIQRPFIIAHPEEITLRVVPWLGTELTWTFTPSVFPMPLKKIISGHADNSAETDIQISY